MRLRSGEQTFTVTVIEAGETPRRWIRVQFRAQTADLHTQAVEAAERGRGGGLFELDAAEAPATEWGIREASASYVGNEPWGMHHHTWLLEQVERTGPLKLVFRALEPTNAEPLVQLAPYDYREEVTPTGLLRLSARGPVSDHELQLIKRACLEARSILRVTRVGISSVEVPMIIEAYLWGPGRLGPGVVLTCSEATGPRLTLAEGRLPADGPLDAATILLAGLVRAGTLPEVDPTAIRASMADELHATWSVPNLDAWPL
jgi:hypothetical protein